MQLLEKSNVNYFPRLVEGVMFVSVNATASLYKIDFVKFIFTLDNWAICLNDRSENTYHQAVKIDP
jgi:hypothetical protein